jgi:hypothetical protein
LETVAKHGASAAFNYHLKPALESVEQSSHHRTAHDEKSEPVARRHA